jgi:hypothetical protein
MEISLEEYKKFILNFNDRVEDNINAKDILGLTSDECEVLKNYINNQNKDISYDDYDKFRGVFKLFCCCCENKYFNFPPMIFSGRNYSSWYMIYVYFYGYRIFPNSDFTFGLDDDELLDDNNLKFLYKFFKITNTYIKFITTITKIMIENY